MNDHDDPRHEIEDRLTDLALGELVGERRPPDLTARIMAAATAPPRRSERPRRALALAACVVFAAGLAASGYAGYLLGRGRSAEQRPAVAKLREPGHDAKNAARSDNPTPPDSLADTRTDGPEVSPETDRDRLAALVDRFNAAMHEKRYSDAEALSQQATEQFPDELITKLLKNTVKVVARSRKGAGSLALNSNGALVASQEVTDLANDKVSYAFGDLKAWERLTKGFRLNARARSGGVFGHRYKGTIDPSLAAQLAHIPAVNEPAVGYPSEKDWQLLAERRKAFKQAHGATAQDIAREALEEKTTISVADQPLNEVLEYLSELHGVKIQLDEEARAERGPRVEKPITLNIAGISLRAALRRLLADLDLDYIIEGGAIVLTSKARASQSREADADVAQRLRTLVRPDFKAIPLDEVMARLAKKAGIDIRLDKPALAQQGVEASVPVTIDLTREVSLKSTLILILGPLNLDFDIEQGGITVRGKRPDNEAVADGDRYPHIVENPFQKAFEFPLSTFSIDVDTASYAKVRRCILQENRLPPPDAVRIEELVNYFDYSDDPPSDADANDATAPVDAAPFAAHVELAACPWQPEHRLARIGIKGRVVPDEQRPAANLVFLIDVSGSMAPDDRLPRVRRAMQLLVDRLRENDRVAIVTYAADSKLVRQSTTGEEKERILLALDELAAAGSTNGADGLRLAYDTAQEHFIEGGVNRVVLCTDGDFNVGLTSQDGLERLIVDRAKSGVFLTALGFGLGNHNDELLEMLADNGNGNYGYIDTEEEARKLLVEQAGGTLQTIAQDVKLQIEFNPRRVAAYRLIGYEDRLLASEDFNDDAKDAGEIGSGHSVTALYELVPAGQEPDAPAASELKYQRPVALTEAAAGDEWLTLSLKYKLPGDRASQSALVVIGRDEEHAVAQASADLRFAAAVAGFGLLLRDSAYRGNLEYDAVIELATGALGDDVSGRRAGFIELVREAKNLAKPK